MSHILLVEDDPLVSAAIAEALTRFGHRVTHAPDGHAAFAICQHTLPDVVVTDILMPDMDGLELIDALKQHSPHLKIVAISGGGSRGTTLHLETAGKFGAHRVLAKPFSISELVAAVDDALGTPDHRSPIAPQ